MSSQQIQILISARDKASRIIRGIQKKLRKLAKTAGKAARGIGKAFKKTAGALLNFKTAVIAMAGAAGFGALAKSIISTGIEFENYRATLKVVLGSQEKANEAFDWLKDFAKTTPFAINTLSESFVKLAAYGIDGTTVMKSLGDASAAMGKDIMQSVEALADAQTGEFERLKEFGIKGIQITKSNATKMGASLEDVGKTALAFTDKMGKEAFKIIDRNNRKQVTSTITSIWNEKYEGAMEERSKTLGGILNNMGDDWMNFKNRVAEKVMPLMKTRLQQFSEAVGKYFLASGGAAEGWENMMSIAMKNSTEYLTGFGASLFNAAYEQGLLFKDMEDNSEKWQQKGRDHADWLLEKFDEFKTWMNSNGESMWDKVKTGADNLLTILNLIATAINTVIAGFRKLNELGSGWGSSLADHVDNAKQRQQGINERAIQNTVKEQSISQNTTTPTPDLASVINNNTINNIYTQNSKHGVENALNSRGEMSLQIGRSTLGLA